MEWWNNGMMDKKCWLFHHSIILFIQKIWEEAGTKISVSIKLMIVCVFFTRCANESVPQGGKQDTEPPVVKNISPPDKTTHFKGDKIQIRFDEYLKYSTFNQTMVSPSPAKRPDIKVSGRTITVKLKSPLRDSTTYTINFADDIQDLNESNTADNFTYVFSTGDYIDSQRVAGNVLLAKDNTPFEGAVVALYSIDSADAILKTKPLYFAKTNKSGYFEIKNVKAGKYYIYALKDQNYNYIYDLPNELIAFTDSVIDLNYTIPPQIEFHLFDENRGRVTLDEVRSLAPGMLQIIYTGPISKFSLTSNLTSEDDFTYFYDTKDTLMYWYSNYYITKDTLFLLANDSVLDTVRMETKFIEKDSLLAKSKFDLAAVNQYVNSKKADSLRDKSTIQELNKPLKIKFPRPIIEISESKSLRLNEDSTQNFQNPKFVVDVKTKQFITVDFSKKENTNYTLQIPDSLFRDIFGVWNKRTNYSFRTNGKDNYGNLHITLQTEHPEKHYIIKLLDANKKVVEEFFFSGNGDRKVTLNEIPAGSYKFEVIDDSNRNGKWDTGNFKRKVQPEKIFTYQDSYQLKGGWDLDVEVKF